MVAARTLIYRILSSPSPQMAQPYPSIHTWAPTMITSSIPLYSYFTQTPYPVLSRWGEMSQGQREISPLACRSSLAVLPRLPESPCLIKTILSVAHSHALYTERETEMFQAPLSSYEQSNNIQPCSPFYQTSCFGWGSFSRMKDKLLCWPGWHQPSEPAAMRNSLEWLYSAFTAITAVFSKDGYWSTVFTRKGL